MSYKEDSINNWKYAFCPACSGKLTISKHPYAKGQKGQKCSNCQRFFHSWNEDIDVKSLKIGFLVNGNIQFVDDPTTTKKLELN